MMSSSSGIKPVYRIVGLEEAVFKERLNRFVGVVRLEGGGEAEVHITNTGRLEEFLVEGKRVLIKGIDGRRLKYRLIGVEDRDGYALIDTMSQMKVFESLLGQGLLPFFRDCIISGRSPKVGGSTLDYLLECRGEKVYLELKSAVLRIGDAASYPDCPSTRGQRHIKELMSIVGAGGRAAIVFIAALPHVKCFKPNIEGDPEIHRLLKEAIEKGVEVYSTSIYLDRDGSVYLENPSLPLCKF